MPDGCTITLNCQGRLVPYEYRSNADVAVTPRIGITDWYPRNTLLNQTVGLAEVEMLNTATGTQQQLVLALEMPFSPAAGTTAVVTMLVQSDSPRDYNQYTFRFDTSFTTISGVETAIEKKTLRFSAFGLNGDQVEVYVNGVRIARGVGADEYQIYDGANSIPENLILFNTSVSLGGSTQVDVIISKAPTIETKTITFYRNTEARRLLRAATLSGSWENIDGYTRFFNGQTRSYYLFTADIKGTVEIDLNTLMSPTGTIAIGPLQAPLSSAYFMLARQPYQSVDRYPDTVVPLSRISEVNYLKYHVVEGEATLQVTKPTAISLYPPARLIKLNPELTIKTASPGVADQLVVDGAVVVGPDT